MVTWWTFFFIDFRGIGKIGIEFLRFHELDDNYVFLLKTTNNHSYKPN